MRATVAFACISALLATAAPVPDAEKSTLSKRGGCYNSAGQWIDDGYWAATNGMTQAPPAGWQPWKNGHSSSECASSSSSGSSGSSSGSSSGYKSPAQNYGTATYFYQNGNAGACGSVNSDSSYGVALDSAAYNGGANCGRSIVLTNTNNGQSIVAKVWDECPTCGGFSNVDLSQGAFDAISGGADGTFSLAWSLQ